MALSIRDGCIVETLAAAVAAAAPCGGVDVGGELRSRALALSFSHALLMLARGLLQYLT